RGIDFVHDSGHQERFLFPEMSSGGAALFDMDADGDLDAYLVQGGEILADPASRPANQLYRNLGGGRFENASAGSGAEDRGYGMGVAAGDYDNDGLTDLYVTNLGANTLLRNLGDGRFEDRSASAGVSGDDWSASAAFLDIDADGWLDLYVVNYVHWNPDLERDCYTDAGRPDYCGPNSYASPAQDRLYRNN
ncbi:MAG: VCBS repeat-containing protein, partial [Planctomycetales bacterium]|nr:VCBS repeat-containing protein [Planctomycetales bacterium]